MMVKKLTANMKEYRKNWYLKNREKILEKLKNYYQKNKEKRIRYGLGYYDKNSEERKKYSKNYGKKVRTEKPYKLVGDFLKENLEYLEKTRSWLGKEAGVTRESSNNWVNGIYIPREEKRKKICEILNIEYSELEKIINECENNN